MFSGTIESLCDLTRICICRQPDQLLLYRSLYGKSCRAGSNVWELSSRRGVFASRLMSGIVTSSHRIWFQHKNCAEGYCA